MRYLSSLPRLLSLALLVIAVPVLADTLPIPALSGRVVDQAGILTSSEESRLTTKVKDLEDKTSIQLVVVTLSSLRGSPIEDWGLALGRTWGIGQKGKDNGALLIVAPNDRELRIEVGYGLEGTLPDAVSKLIIENGITPRFRANDYAGGITRGVDDIIQVLTGDAEEWKRRAAAQRPEVKSWPIDFGTILLVCFVIFIVVQVIRSYNQPPLQAGRRGRRRGSDAGWVIPSGGGWSDSSSWGSGGGFSDGGGFSGGGGDSGGGGASGSW
jgi:uncharacterized protein